jgi:hypothetical protein
MVSSGYGLRAARFRAPPSTLPAPYDAGLAVNAGRASALCTGRGKCGLVGQPRTARPVACLSQQQAGARLVRRTIPSYRTYDAYHEVVRYM